MGTFYSLYGLRLEANVSIPGLTRLTDDLYPNVRVWFGAMPWWFDDIVNTCPQTCYASADCDRDGRPLLKVHQVSDGEYFRLTYADGTAFLINRAGTRIWSTWPETLSLEDTVVYLLGPIIGFALRLRDVTCLHASAIAIGKEAIALIGPGGAGKSTTAAAFAHRGHAVLADDVVALHESGPAFLVQPGYPHVRLWPKSVEMLYRSSEALPPLTPNWDKRYLDLVEAGCQFQRTPLRLGAMYIFSERCAEPSAPVVEAMSAREALMTLVENTYVNYLLESTMRAKEFTVLTRLVERIPIRRIRPHVDPARLSELCDVILEDSHALSASSV